jgi:hydrogenase nickel incorporation protein HypA/HybF
MVGFMRYRPLFIFMIRNRLEGSKQIIYRHMVYRIFLPTTAGILQPYMVFFKFIQPIAMHELGIAQNILEIVQQSVPESQESAVREIRIKVGQLSGIVPDSLDFCFSAIVNDTKMRQARLAIEQVPTLSQCKKCSHRFGIEDWIFLCPVCQSTNLELISGKELEIVEIELADECEEAI